MSRPRTDRPDFIIIIGGGANAAGDACLQKNSVITRSKHPSCNASLKAWPETNRQAQRVAGVAQTQVHNPNTHTCTPTPAHPLFASPPHTSQHPNTATATHHPPPLDHQPTITPLDTMLRYTLLAGLASCVAAIPVAPAGPVARRSSQGRSPRHLPQRWRRLQRRHRQLGHPRTRN